MMTRLMTLTIAALLTMSAAAPVTAQEPPRSEAPERGDVARALTALLAADTFEDVYIGYAGSLSPNAAAFRILHASPRRVELFTRLVREGSAVGQLYGAIGLYGEDAKVFQWAVGVLRARQDERVATQFGCLGGAETVGALLEAKGAMRLKPGQTATEWLAVHGSGSLDIVGGGYPSVFTEGARP